MTDLPEGFILPDLGDEPPAIPQRSRTAVDPYTPTRKLSLICSKGNLDMAYPGLILANAAASEGLEVHMFFTFWGLDIIHERMNHKLRFTMIGNTAMHMPGFSKVRKGMEFASIPQILGRIPGMTWWATRFMKRQIADLNVPDVPDFLDLLAAEGVNLYACRMSFNMMKLREEDLHPAVQGVLTAAEFIEVSDEAQTIFI